MVYFFKTFDQCITLLKKKCNMKPIEGFNISKEIHTQLQFHEPKIATYKRKVNLNRFQLP